MRAVSICAMAGVALGCLAAGAEAQIVSKSADPAKALVAQLEARKLDSVAVKDPANPRRFVAVLYIPGSQLLLMSAVYPVPELIEPKLASGDFRGIYTDLNASGLPDSRVFVQDLQANGLQPTCGKEQPFDIFSSDKEETLFDGNLQKQKLTEAEYNARFTKADEQYAKWLTLLGNVLKSGT